MTNEQAVRKLLQWHEQKMKAEFRKNMKYVPLKILALLFLGLGVIALDYFLIRSLIGALP